MIFRGKVFLTVIAAIAMVGLFHLLGASAIERLVISASNNVIINLGADRPKN